MKGVRCAAASPFVNASAAAFPFTPLMQTPLYFHARRVLPRLHQRRRLDSRPPPTRLALKRPSGNRPFPSQEREQTEVLVKIKERRGAAGGAARGGGGGCSSWCSPLGAGRDLGQHIASSAFLQTCRSKPALLRASASPLPLHAAPAARGTAPRRERSCRPPRSIGTLDAFH